MTSVTVKTYPTPKLLHMILTIATLSALPPAKGTWDMLAYVLAQYPSLGDAGLAGYSFLFDNFNPTFGSPAVSGVQASFVLQDTQDAKDMLKLWTPIFEHINTTWPGFSIVPNITEYSSFWEWYQPNKDDFAAGKNQYIFSRLLDDKALTGDRNATRDAFRALSASGTGTAYLVSGKGVWNAKPRGGSNAVLPAWRKAYVHASKYPVDQSRSTGKLTRL